MFRQVGRPQVERRERGDVAAQVVLSQTARPDIHDGDVQRVHRGVQSRGDPQET